MEGWKASEDELMFQRPRKGPMLFQKDGKKVSPGS